MSVSASLIGLDIYVGQVCVGTVDTDSTKYAFTPKKIKTSGNFTTINTEKFYHYLDENGNEWVFFVKEFCANNIVQFERVANYIVLV